MLFTVYLLLTARCARRVTYECSIDDVTATLTAVKEKKASPVIRLRKVRTWRLVGEKVVRPKPDQPDCLLMVTSIPFDT